MKAEEFEQYKPSEREVKGAEDSMTDEQRKLSEAREEGYKLAESKQQKAEEKLDESYHEELTVNLFKISVAPDAQNKEFVIYFPQILNDTYTMALRGVREDFIRINKRPEDAKKVFDYASKLAKSTKDIFYIYGMVKDFVQAIEHEKE